ncbi:MAG: GNAT family N-acetyltransferase [Methyloprofundus sp.]|nr:GNAT family N-acetyltransferase [Methyloprofundus sp.]
MPSTEKVSYQLTTNLSLAHAIEHFSDLTFPDIARYAQAKKITEPLLGIVASVNGQAYGVLLAENKGHSFKILTWFVHKAYRNQGIGENLLLKLEKVLLKNNACDLLFIDYDADWEGSAWMESIFKKNNWQSPKDNLWMCATERKLISQAPWLDIVPKMRGLEVFAWQNITLLERLQLLQETFYPPIHNPFVDETRIALAYSYGIRKDNKIIGWLITHQISATTIQYSNFFIHSAYRKNGHAIGILIKAIKQQIADHKFEKFVFQIPPSSGQMAFLKKRLEPYLIYKSIMRSNAKTLRDK